MRVNKICSTRGHRPTDETKGKKYRVCARCGIEYVQKVHPWRRWNEEKDEAPRPPRFKN